MKEKRCFNLIELCVNAYNKLIAWDKQKKIVTMTTKEFLVKLSEDLKSLDLYSDFKLRKADTRFIKKIDGGTIYAEFTHVTPWDEVVIYPIYCVRYDILHKWFEKFSFKTLKDQRNSSSKMISGGSMGLPTHFYFNLDGSNYEEEFKKLAEVSDRCTKWVTEHLYPMDKLFETVVLPYIKGEKEMPTGGADWIFIYLGACKLVAPELYPKFKSIMLEHVKWMYERKEPNVEHYYDHMDEILSYMEAYMEDPKNLKRQTVFQPRSGVIVVNPGQFHARGHGQEPHQLPRRGRS